MLTQQFQAKQRKNNRKVKDKEREERSDSKILERGKDVSTNHDREDSKQVGQSAVEADNFGQRALDLSDNLSGSTGVCQTDTCDKITEPVTVNAMNDVGIEMNNSQTWKDDSTVDIETLVTSVSAAVNSIRGKINNLLDSTSHITPNRSVSISSKICDISLASLDLIIYHH